MKHAYTRGNGAVAAAAIASALALGQAPCLAAGAQEPAVSSPSRQPPEKAAVSGRDARASQLMGKNVRNAKGEDLGDIQDLVIDMDTGKVHYAVLSFGGILGMGDKWFAYPLTVFRPGAEKDELILNVDQVQLKNAEGFEKNRWPNWNDPEYRGRVEKPFSKQAAASKSGRYKRLKDLIGGDVKDANGKDIGDIREIVVNLGDGHVRYAIIEFERGWLKGDKYVVVPMRFLKRTGDKDDFTVAISRTELENAPAFEKGKWPDINDAKYRSTFDRYIDPSRKAN